MNNITKKQLTNSLPLDHWARGAVVYHIYPLSFNDSDGDGKGDIVGIIEKLDYLNDGTKNSLGVTAIWISPIYKSPMKDFGYDVSNYYDVDPIFGDLSKFDDLISECHKRNIKVIMDIVPNHTSTEHPWFLESKSSRDNPKRDWYIWKDALLDGSPPNNWLSRFGGSAWKYDERTKQYYLHTFLPEQADLNWRNPDVREEMLSVIRFWLARGVDGFKTDSSNFLLKGAEFKDDTSNPDYASEKNDSCNSINGQKQTETIDATNTFCGAIAVEGSNKFIISEAYLNLKNVSELYKTCENKLHTSINFNFITLPWNASEYKKYIDNFMDAVGPNDVPNYVVGNHDHKRLASRIGREKIAPLAMLTMSLPGMPIIYYGQEIGMFDGDVPEEKILDPLGKINVKYNRDGSRTPMQWDATKFAGFSMVESWLPIGKDHKNINVANESIKQNSILNLYKRLIHYRNSSNPILIGEYIPMSLKSGERVISFIRRFEDKILLIATNFSSDTVNVEYTSKDLRNISTNKINSKLIINTYLDRLGEKLNVANLLLRPNEACIVELEYKHIHWFSMRAAFMISHILEKLGFAFMNASKFLKKNLPKLIWKEDE